MGPLLTLFSNPLPTPLLTRPLKDYFYRHFGVADADFLFIESQQRALLRWVTLSQIASDLRVAIRITSRNRSQIARFGSTVCRLGAL